MAENAAAGVGHNYPDEICVLQHVRAITEEQARVKREQAELTRLRKCAKADGITLKLLDEAITMSEWSLEERKAVELERARLREYMRMPIGGQFELFNEPADNPLSDDNAAAERLVERAFDDGFRAAILSVGITENPHDGNTPAGQRWLAGWHEGNAKVEHERRDFDDDDDEDGEEAA